MQKTTVYLTDEQAEALGRVSRATGKSRSDLIREGIDRVTRTHGGERAFHSMGVADGPTERLGRRAEELLEAGWGAAIDRRGT